MKIGIAGLGVVGSACKAGFEKCGYEVVIHDPKLFTQIHELIDTEIVYVCVPTPAKQDGTCDTSIVHEIIVELMRQNYDGIIAIKSTIPPGTTQQFIERYSDRIVFVPEFLKELVLSMTLFLIIDYYWLVQKMLITIMLLFAVTVTCLKVR